MRFETDCPSITGKFLYSDAYLFVDEENEIEGARFPVLNTIAAIPFIGPLAGIARMALAIIHMSGHTFAAIIFWERGHMYHVAKGGAELLRGGIETIPIVGRIFVWKFDANHITEFKMEWNKRHAEKKAKANGIKRPAMLGGKRSVFLIEIRHSNANPMYDLWDDGINSSFYPT